MTKNPIILLPDTNPLSVSRLNLMIQELLEQNQSLQQIWVIGEVSSANKHSSGLFFTLQDPNAKASIKAVIWNQNLNNLFKKPTTGEQVIVLGTLRIYHPRGEYQLSVNQVVPSGEGLQALRSRELRDRLEKEGLFEPSRKRPLPPHPHTIAVVTSPQAAAWGDIQKTLKNRYPGLKVLFSPALVQGDLAGNSIVQAINRVANKGIAQVLILARGGGAVEDLSCFNDEKVVRAISNCPIPVITGIGHERDKSLADLAADYCAHTPTAAAETAVPSLATLYQQHQQRQLQLGQAIAYRVKYLDEQLQRLRDRLIQIHPDRIILREKQQINWLKKQLQTAVNQKLSHETQRCIQLKQELIALDPESVLNRGYSIVRDQESKIIRDSKELQLNQTLSIQLNQGKIEVIISQIQPDNT